ncbi:hypothetical protein [Oceanicola sp. 22II-s10i]|uniref:hypothetical protein n=1 Tax=Oceanicola sp. 22II-s10i TaxID=1317116 RepID=UPI001130813D|nr:hypothetical protein [Oceanicola sp. 22II-s10i]
MAARQELGAIIAPDKHPRVLDAEYIYFCGIFDGRLWLSRVTEAFVLQSTRQMGFGHMAYDRKVRLVSEAGCPDMRSEDIDFPRLSAPDP